MNFCNYFFASFFAALIKAFRQDEQKEPKEICFERMLSPETSPTGKSNSKSAQGEVGSNSWDAKTSTSLGLRTHKLASDCNKDTTKTELQEVTSSIS